MNQYLTLLKVQFNQRYGLSVIRSELRENPRKMIGKLAVFAVAVISVGAMLVVYAWLLSKLMPAFHQAGFADILLGLALLTSMVLVFFMGFFYLLGFLFFAKDTEFLFSLPVPQRTIFASKFTQVLFGEIGMSILMLLPAFVIYGTQTSADVFYWLRIIPTVLLAPFIPLALSGILALLLMRFNAIWRRRDLLTIIGSVVLVVAVFGVQMIFPSIFQEDMTQAELMALAVNQSALMQRIVSAFPPSGWAAEGLLFGGSNLLLFCAVSVVSLIAILFLSNFIYKSGAIAQTESLRKSRAVNITQRAMKSRGAMSAYFAKEWKLMLRSPVYAMNGLIVILIGPIMVVLMVLTNGASGGEFDLLFAMIQSAVDWRLGALCISAFFLLISSMNTSISTSVSREGKQFYLMRVYPMAAKRQIFAKFLMGYSVAAITVAVMTAAVSILLPLAPITILVSMALGLIASLAPTALSMIPDVIRPKLEWNTETEAIKQNMNTIIALAIGWAYVAAIGFLSYLLLSKDVDAGFVLGMDVVLCAITGALSVWALGNVAQKSLMRIEG